MSLTDDIRDTFRKAALQNEAAKGLNSDDWAQYRQILSDHERHKRDELQSHHGNYQTRLEAVRSYLIDQAASKGRPLLPRMLGRDGFNRAEIDRQAHRAVQDDHSQKLAQIDAGKDAKLKALTDGAQQRQVLKNQLKEDFAGATDRRSIAERRTGPKRLH
ncbi:hypothetical protein [uncultured Devosia sp.]|uniref:hypothetical protein n=1 Tax=uncultured Devosia sp. TaxID=211434 RepID=UPI0035CC30D8